MITLEKVISSIEMRFTKQGNLRGVAVYERLITMEDGERLEGSKDQELDPRSLNVDDAIAFMNEQAMTAMVENVQLLAELNAANGELEPLKNELQESRHQVALLKAEIEAMKSVLVTL
jgi:hypothetical protein